MSSEHSDSIKINEGLNSTEVRVPSSKSHANRMLVLAAISKERITLKNLPDGTDVQTMLSCLKEIGLKINDIDDGVEILNSFPECEKENDLIVLETGDGGTTNRFLMPLLARGRKKYQMNMAAPMRVRPMDDLTNPMSEMGVKIEKNAKGYLVQGPYLNSGEYSIDCSKSTQFGSGLLMGISDLEGFEVKASNIQYSEKYFKITEELIEDFKTSTDFMTPVDASSLGYAVAAGLTLKYICVPNCHQIDKFQADSAIFDLLDQMGGKCSFDSGCLEVMYTKELMSFSADCGDYPDLVPTLAYLASYAKGTTTLSNLEVLTHKESDRFLEIKKQLQQIGINFEEEGFTLKIHGTQDKKEPFEYQAPDDHRMIMTAALHMMKNSGGMISNWKHVKKSFPSFFEEFK
jgi:3-phosphoshikimate 1-carboxyvinyltransferase